MINYIVDVNLGSEGKITDITKFLRYTRKKDKVFQMVYGGTKYITELKRVTKLLKYINELRKTNQAFEIPKDLVDKEQIKFEELSNKVCDDPHIYAIVHISSCNIVASQDEGISHFYKVYTEYTKPYIYKSDSLYKSLITKFK